MKAIVNLKEFQVAIKKIKKVVGKFKAEKGLQELLCNIKVVSKGERLSIIGSDLDATILLSIPAEVTTEGESLLNQEIFKTIEKMKDGYITVTDTEVIGVKRSITYSDSNENKKIEEFVQLPKNREDIAFVTTGENLLDKFRIKFATSNDDSRPAFTGILIRGNKMIASDTYRMSIREAGFDNSRESDIIIPQKNVKILESIIDKNTDVSCAVDGNFAIFSGEGFVCAVRMIPEKFPDFERIVPKDDAFNYTFVMIAKEAIEEISFLQAFYNQEGYQNARITLDENEITATKECNGKTASVKIPIYNLTGNDRNGKIILNHDYLIDVFKFAGQDEVLVKIIDAKSPVIFEVSGGIDLMLPVIQEQPL